MVQYRINPCKGCMKKVSGMDIPDINELNSCCYNMSALAVGANSVSDLRGTPLVDNAADCVCEAMHNMGRAPCNFKLSPPPIFVSKYPSLFSYMGDGQSPDKALLSCETYCRDSPGCPRRQECLDSCRLQHSCIEAFPSLDEVKAFDLHDPEVNTSVACERDLTMPWVQVPVYEDFKSDSPANPTTPRSPVSSLTPCPKTLEESDCECGGRTFLDADRCPLVICDSCEPNPTTLKDYRLAYPAAFITAFAVTTLILGVLLVFAVWAIFGNSRRRDLKTLRVR